MEILAWVCLSLGGIEAVRFLLLICLKKKIEISEITQLPGSAFLTKVMGSSQQVILKGIWGTNAVYTTPFSSHVLFAADPFLSSLESWLFWYCIAVRCPTLFSLSWLFCVFFLLLLWFLLLVRCVGINPIPAECQCLGIQYVQLYMHTPIYLASQPLRLLIYYSLNIMWQLFLSFCLLNFLVGDYMRLCEILSPFPWLHPSVGYKVDQALML